MNWFKTEFAKSSIISGFLAIAIWAAIIYLAVFERLIPDVLIAGGMAIISFHYGAKMGQRDGVASASRIIETKLKERQDARLHG